MAESTNDMLRKKKEKELLLIVLLYIFTAEGVCLILQQGGVSLVYNS